MGLIGFSLGEYRNININDIEMLNNNLDGSEPKISIKYKGEFYILKYQKNDWENLRSEHYASKMCNLIKPSIAHETELVIIDGIKAVKLKDFISNRNDCAELHPYFSLDQTYSTGFAYNSKNDIGYDYKDVIKSINRLKTANNITKKEIADVFHHQFILDALLGNTDRHAGNWGVIVEKHRVVDIAKIFDNGASLFPRCKEVFIVTNKISDKSEIKDRVINFPNSKIMLNKEDRRRGSYYEIIHNTDNIPNQIKDYYQDLDILNILDKCFSTVEDDLARIFYKTILYYRYSTIIQGRDFVWEGVIK